MRSLGSSGFSVLFSALLPALGLACSAGEPGASGEPDLGSGEPDVLTSSNTDPPAGESKTPPSVPELDCASADLHAVATSLAVAVANELHRWDALSDFELRSGKLVLSATGEL